MAMQPRPTSPTSKPLEPSVRVRIAPGWHARTFSLEISGCTPFVVVGMSMRRSDARPGRTTDSRWPAMVVLCAGMLMIVLDQTIVNVALPTIRTDLGFSQAGLAWVVNAYLIAFGGLLLLAGRLGDLAGRRDVFLAGLAIFTVASMACGLAVNQEMLIVARFAQGTGGALTSA